MMDVINLWADIAVKLKPALQQGILNTADAMAGLIESGAPVDTGFMSSNIYVSTWEGSTYGTGDSPPTDDAYLLPETPSPDDTTAIVGAAANYSIFVEMGHVTRSGSYVPAQPFFLPGVEAARPIFEEEMTIALTEGLLP